MGGNRFSRPPVVATDHHRLQAGGLHATDRLTRICLQAVGNGNQPGHALVRGDRHHGESFLLHPIYVIANRSDVQTFVGERARAAYQNGNAAHGGPYTAPGDGLKVPRGHGWHSDMLGMIDNRSGQRMLRRALGPCCQGEDLILCVAVEGRYFDHFGLAQGNSASLVEHHLLYILEDLEGLAGAHEDTFLRGHSATANHSQRCRHAERARIAHHQYRQGREHRSAEIGGPGKQPRTQAPKQEGSGSRDQHTRYKVFQHLIDKHHDARL